MNWYKTAQSKKVEIVEPFKRAMPYITASTESDVRDLKDKIDGIKNLEKRVKDVEKDIKDVKKDIKDFNMGERRYWQEKTSFTSIQRKIEKFEKMMSEWNKYKSEMNDEVKRLEHVENTIYFSKIYLYSDMSKFAVFMIDRD